jgi:para-nitrobenzyl esterase
MQELFTTGRFNRVPVIAGTNSSDSSGNACSTQTFSQQLARWIPVYRYEFADETAPPLPGRDVSIAGRGAQHSAELMYLYQFNGYTASFDPDQQDLSDAMTLYWSQFVHEGDPNADDLPAWPRFTSRSQSVIRFTKTAIGATTDFAQRYACV